MGPSAEAKWAWIVLVPFYLPVNLHSRQLDYTLPLMRQALSHSRLPSRVLCSSQPFGFSSLAFENGLLRPFSSSSSMYSSSETFRQESGQEVRTAQLEESTIRVSSEPTSSFSTDVTSCQAKAISTNTASPIEKATRPAKPYDPLAMQKRLTFDSLTEVVDASGARVDPSARSTPSPVSTVLPFKADACLTLPSSSTPLLDRPPPVSGPSPPKVKRTSTCPSRITALSPSTINTSKPMATFSSPNIPAPPCSKPTVASVRKQRRGVDQVPPEKRVRIPKARQDTVVVWRRSSAVEPSSEFSGPEFNSQPHSLDTANVLQPATTPASKAPLFPPRSSTSTPASLFTTRLRRRSATPKPSSSAPPPLSKSPEVFLAASTSIPPSPHAVTILPQAAAISPRHPAALPTPTSSSSFLPPPKTSEAPARPLTARESALFKWQAERARLKASFVEKANGVTMVTTKLLGGNVASVAVDVAKLEHGNSRPPVQSAALPAVEEKVEPRTIFPPESAAVSSPVETKVSLGKTKIDQPREGNPFSSDRVTTWSPILPTGSMVEIGLTDSTYLVAEPLARSEDGQDLRVILCVPREAPQFTRHALGSPDRMKWIEAQIGASYTVQKVWQNSEGEGDLLRIVVRAGTLAKIQACARELDAVVAMCCTHPLKVAKANAWGVLRLAAATTYLPAPKSLLSEEDAWTRLSQDQDGLSIEASNPEPPALPIPPPTSIFADEAILSDLLCSISPSPSPSSILSSSSSPFSPSGPSKLSRPAFRLPRSEMTSAWDAKPSNARAEATGNATVTPSSRSGGLKVPAQVTLLRSMLATVSHTPPSPTAIRNAVFSLSSVDGKPSPDPRVLLHALHLACLTPPVPHVVEARSALFTSLYAELDRARPLWRTEDLVIPESSDALAEERALLRRSLDIVERELRIDGHIVAAGGAGPWEGLERRFGLRKTREEEAMEGEVWLRPGGSGAMRAGWRRGAVKPPALTDFTAPF